MSKDEHVQDLLKNVRPFFAKKERDEASCSKSKGNFPLEDFASLPYSSKDYNVFARWRCSFCSTTFNYAPKAHEVDQNYFNCVDCYSHITIQCKRVK